MEVANESDRVKSKYIELRVEYLRIIFADLGFLICKRRLGGNNRFREANIDNLGVRIQFLLNEVRQFPTRSTSNLYPTHIAENASRST